MAQLCAPSSPSIDDDNEKNMVKAKLKRSPRCMQIDLLPLLATNITMMRTQRPNRQNQKILPAVWDGQLHLWTRNLGTLLPSIQPSIQTLNANQFVEEQTEPQLVHTKGPILWENLDNDADQIHDLLTISDLHESFSRISIASAPGKAWLSSMADESNYQATDVIAPSVAWIERETHPEETSQLLLDVETICTNPDVWNAVKQQGSSMDRAPGLDHNHQYATLTMKDDGDEECSRVLEDHFVEPQVNKHLKLCPAFVSPWFDRKTHPLPDCQEVLDICPNGGLGWTGDETTECDDKQNFDGVGLRPQSESNRVRSRQYWNGENEDSSKRSVRQPVEDHSNQRIIGNEFLDNYDGFEPGDNLTGWFPQPGDIMVTKGSRAGDLFSPGGHVTLYKDEEFFFFTREARDIRMTQYDFEDGDFVIRLGKFTEDWKWRPNPSIEAFLCDLRQVRPWWLVARTHNNDLQSPEYQFDQFRAPLNSVDQTFCPRQADLVVRAVPGEYKWGLNWWDLDFEFNPCDLVLRTGYEVRANGTCIVVELFSRELNNRDWSFRGRDVWTYLSVPGLGPQPA